MRRITAILLMLLCLAPTALADAQSYTFTFDIQGDLAEALDATPETEYTIAVMNDGVDVGTFKIKNGESFLLRIDGDVLLDVRFPATTPVAYGYNVEFYPELDDPAYPLNWTVHARVGKMAWITPTYSVSTSVALPEDVRTLGVMQVFDGEAHRYSYALAPGEPRQFGVMEGYTVEVMPVALEGAEVAVETEPKGPVTVDGDMNMQIEMTVKAK